MSVEMAVKEATSVTQKTVKEGINLVKKAWSLMDAASEKKTPGEYLSQGAIESIQGKRNG